jgi:hypothetical protein
MLAPIASVLQHLVWPPELQGAYCNILRCLLGFVDLSGEDSVIMCSAHLFWCMGPVAFSGS